MPDSKRTPYYMHVAESIVKKIALGEIPRGGRIPSIRELSQNFNVAKSTVERALYRLVDRGVLRSEQGRGIFVVDKPARHADGMTHVVGFLAPMHAGTYMGKGFYANVLAGIQEALAGADRSLLVINESGLGHADESANLHEDLVDGYVVIGPVGKQFISLLRKVGKPMIFVDHDASGLGYDSVVADNLKGSLLMTKHLLDFGHRQIVFLGGLLRSEPDPEDKHYIDTAARERFAGFRIGMEMAGIDVRDESHALRVVERTIEDAHASIREFWENGRRATAIVCFGGGDAEGAITYLNENGVNVPEDVSVVGFAAGEKTAGKVLTGVDFNARDMGVAAGELILERVQRGYDAFRTEIIPVSFVEGDTTAVAPQV
ncbi:MAG: GntR family transcriptional regulator [Planctomycetes bacterium]|nr:GntR family transcriptional regulator [Planctomycetota bacterium]